MLKQKLSFVYFLAWLVLGAFLGILALLYRGDVSLLVNSPDPRENLELTQQNTATNQIASYAEAVMKAAPAVVSIQTIVWSQTVDAANPDDDIRQDSIRNGFLGQNSPHRPKKQAETASGSGVIIRASGYILTNYHVISDRDEIRVRLSDGRVAVAKLIGSDPDTDLAVLKIDLQDLPSLPIADTSKYRVGDIVLAIGDPFAIGQTVTQGIISATGRTRVSQNTYENFIQTDAAINPGNSGGALINTPGEIIGINSNIFSSTGNYQGISFAIPIDLAQKVAEQIIENGFVVRGWLGVEGQELTSQILQSVELQSMHGILITDVDAAGPGDIAGLKRGDIITRINEKEILSTVDILNLVAAGRPGDEFIIEGIRQRQGFTTKAILGQRPLMSR